MPDSPELAELISEYTTMEVAAEPQRAKAILLRAASLVDRAAAPKKWAAFRNAFADLAEKDDPPAAIAAYRDALTVWGPEVNRVSWSYCQMQLGSLLATNFPPGSPEGEEAIAHLELAVPDETYLAGLLATLYGMRPVGDPEENWRRRIHYLQQAIAAVDRTTEKEKWARLNNALACAYAEEPGANFALVLEKQIALHLDVLATLKETDGPFAETCIDLGTAFLNRTEGQLTENGTRAEENLRRALAVCVENDGGAQRAQILLLLGRCLVFKETARAPDNVYEALPLYQEARALVAKRPQVELRASVEKFAANAYLKLLQLGEHQHLQEFCACCERALELFAGPTFLVERRKILQIEADGFLTVRDFAKAGDCCAQAVTAAETLLAQTNTTSGRLERIWELRDSTALLAFCRAKAGDLIAAIEALDRGKALLWDRGDVANIAQHVGGFIPSRGALLFPLFTADEGIFLIVTGTQAAPVFTQLSLPRFGKARLTELLSGPSAAELGGWLRAYCFRHSEPARFRQEIETLGQILYAELWEVLLSQLSELGVQEGAELVIFPQAGCGILPLHAAWKMEEGEKRWLLDLHAIRYAPALKMLVQAERPPLAAATISVIANPTGDLASSALEVEWIRDACPTARLLAPEEATKEKVLEEILASERVHLATHADFDLDDAFASSLRVAKGERLTLQELAPHLASRRPAFIALSACETAVTRVTSVQDEFLGFPSALLAHGVGTVLATQWPVDDVSTAVLVGRFYREYIGSLCSAAEALRRAQNWLRELTVAEFSALLRPLRERPGEAGRLATATRSLLRGREPKEKLFAHPYFWAAFTISGGT